MSIHPRFLNFADGFKLASRRLRARTPPAPEPGRACLNGHRLAWHVVVRDGSGNGAIVAGAGESVCGVVCHQPAL